MSAPLTIGTAGHIDHGKTVLVRALTGIDTDRLPQERERGISIELGFAALELPSGRQVSVVDVPGHERFVRTMVAGATGIDMFLLVVAADDGAMPQTREHLRVLGALGVTTGVVAITKADAVSADRVSAVAAEVKDLLDGSFDPQPEAIPVCAPRGTGLGSLVAAIERAAAALPGRATAPGPARLYVDRSFTLRGRGTVVTGTLWAGGLAAGDRVRVEPSGAEHRIRSLQVHGQAVERAAAGQRVAANLAGADRREISRGDVLTHPGAGLRPTHRVEARLELAPGAAALERGARVQVHHGTRESAARVVPSERERVVPGVPAPVQLRLERPLMVVAGDRLVVRQIAPPDTLGGGVVLAVTADRPDAEDVAQAPHPAPEPPGPEQVRLAEALRQELHAAGLEPPNVGELAERAGAPRGAVERALSLLQESGAAVRTGRELYFDAEALDRARTAVVEACRRDGAVTIAGLRDELGTSRRYAQALLERFDAERLLVRVGDEHRLRGASVSPNR